MCLFLVSVDQDTARHELSTNLLSVNPLLLAGNQVLDGHLIFRKLLEANDDHETGTTTGSVADLATDAGFRAHVELGTQVATTQFGRHPDGLEAEAVLRTDDHDLRSHDGLVVQEAERFHGSEETVDADRSSGSRNALLAEATDQTVETATGKDRAKLGQIGEHSLEDRAGVVAEATSHGQVQLPTLGIHTRGFDATHDLLELLEAGAGFGHGAHQVGQLLLDFFVVTLDADELDQLADDVDGKAGTVVPLIDRLDGQFFLDAFEADLVQLVQDAEHRGDLVRIEAGVVGKGVEDLSGVDPDHELGDLQSAHDRVDHVDDLDVRQQAGGTDSVSVELSKLPITTGLGLFAAKHTTHLPALEGLGQIRILGDHSCQRHSQVKTQGQRVPILARVLDPEDVPAEVGIAAGEHFFALQHRSFERHEAESLVNIDDLGDDVPPLGCLFGQQVTDACRASRFDDPIVHRTRFLSGGLYGARLTVYQGASVTCVTLV